MKYKMTCEDCGKTWEKASPQKRCISCCGNDVSRILVPDSEPSTKESGQERKDD